MISTVAMLLFNLKVVSLIYWAVNLLICVVIRSWLTEGHKPWRHAWNDMEWQLLAIISVSNWCSNYLLLYCATKYCRCRRHTWLNCQNKTLFYLTCRNLISSWLKLHSQCLFCCPHSWLHMERYIDARIHYSQLHWNSLWQHHILLSIGQYHSPLHGVS